MNLKGNISTGILIIVLVITAIIAWNYYSPTISLPKPKTLWEYQITKFERYHENSGGGIMAADLKIKDKYAIVTGAGTITALDKNTGKTIWTFTPPYDINLLIFSVSDKRILVHGYPENAIPEFNSIIYSLDLESGKIVWEKPLEEVYPQYFETDDLYLTSGFESLSRVSAEDGQTIWQIPLSKIVGNAGSYSLGTNAASEDTLYIQVTGNNNVSGSFNIIALDIKSGGIKWKTPLPGQYSGVKTPFFSEDKLFVEIQNSDTFEDKHLVILDKTTGQKLGETKITSHSNFTVDKNTLYKIEPYDDKYIKNKFQAINLEDMNVKWTYWGDEKTQGYYYLTFGPFFLEGNIIYLQDNMSNIAALDASSGKKLWSEEIKGSGLKLMGDKSLFLLHSIHSPKKDYFAWFFGGEDIEHYTTSSYVTKLRKFDINSKRLVWEFPHPILDQNSIQNEGDTAFFFAQTGHDNYSLFSVK